ncbi:hypothetical protein [uncultured Tateyamaria sp.]|uniref:phage tail protein n=1 Tax=uncultured Tateyamaria sp. TaxID=455651 RepID=UPI00262FC9C6|nr:hypothetical protein [uncultured Tateyamaria sp.]
MIEVKRTLLSIFSISLLVALPRLGKAEDSGSVSARLDALEKQVRILNTVIPKGAVMAFNLEDCPIGWAPFSEAAGRTLIGAGKGDGLSDRKLGHSGGAENHKLTPAEMPTHSHMQRVGQHAITKNKITAWNLANPLTGGARDLHHTGTAGSGQEHNNMQPFAVVTYCKREM